MLSAAAESDECPNVIMVDDRKLILTGGLPVLEEVLPNATVTGFTDASEAVKYAKPPLSRPSKQIIEAQYERFL